MRRENRPNLNTLFRIFDVALLDLGAEQNELPFNFDLALLQILTEESILPFLEPEQKRDVLNWLKEGEIEQAQRVLELKMALEEKLTPVFKTVEDDLMSNPREYDIFSQVRNMYQRLDKFFAYYDPFNHNDELKNIEKYIQADKSDRYWIIPVVNTVINWIQDELAHQANLGIPRKTTMTDIELTLKIAFKIAS